MSITPTAKATGRRQGGRPRLRAPARAAARAPPTARTDAHILMNEYSSGHIPDTCTNSIQRNLTHFST